MEIINLAIEFFIIGAVTFGGGNAMIPLLMEVSADNGWIPVSKFADFIAISQITPGPVAINLATFVGFSALGAAGAVVSSYALILPGFITSFLIRFVNKHHILYTSIIRCLKITVIALLAFAIVNIGRSSLKFEWIYLVLFPAALLLNRWSRIPLLAQMAIFALLGVVCF